MRCAVQGEVAELLAHYDAWRHSQESDENHHDAAGSSAAVCEALDRLHEGELEKTFKRSSSHAVQGHPDDDTLLRMHMLHRGTCTVV